MACSVADRVAEDGGLPTRFVGMRNIAESPYRYLMDPDEQLRVLLEIDDNDEVVWGIVHSHVASPPYPSPTDVGLAAYPDAIYVLASFADEPPELRAWTIVQRRGQRGRARTHLAALVAHHAGARRTLSALLDMGGRMSQLLVITFGARETAGQAAERLKSINKAHAVSIQDMAVVEKDDDEKVHVHHGMDAATAGGAIGGGVLGLLLGLVFFPIGGLLIGVAAGAFIGRSLHHNVDKKLIEDVTNDLSANTSALFVIGDGSDIGGGRRTGALQGQDLPDHAGLGDRGTAPGCPRQGAAELADGAGQALVAGQHEVPPGVIAGSLSACGPARSSLGFGAPAVLHYSSPMSSFQTSG